MENSRYILRQATKEDYPKVLALINEVFRLSRGHKPTMAKEFPLLLGPNNTDNMTLIEVEGQVVSDVNYWNTCVDLEGGSLKVASIGGVCSHKDYEGRGYSSKILDAVEDKMKAEGVDVLLVSGDRSLYTRRACSKVKCFRKYSLEGQEAKTHGLEYVAYHRTYLEDMHRLYCQNTVKFQRSLEDFESLLEGATVPWGTYSYKKIVILKDKVFAGYIVLRCIDEEVLRGEVTEIYSQGLDTLDCLEHVAYGQGLDHLHYWQHVHEKPLDHAWSIDYLHGTLKVMNFKHLMEKMSPYMITKVREATYKSLSFSQDQDKYYISDGHEVYTIESTDALNKLLFQGWQSKPAGPGIQNFIDKVLPLPFVWPMNLNYQ